MLYILLHNSKIFYYMLFISRKNGGNMINKLNSTAFKGKILTDAITFKHGEFKRNTLLTEQLSEREPEETEIDSKNVWSIKKLPEEGYTQIAAVKNGNTYYHYIPMEQASTAEILAAYNAASTIESVIL